MLNHVPRLLCLGAAALCCLMLWACPNRAGGGDDSECESDAECTGSLPYCVPETKVCAECLQHDHCDCHQTCANNACEALGAKDASQRFNAHGDWEGVPTEASYRHLLTCADQSDCGLGEVCNPLTGGCILAAQYIERCADNRTCPEGPNGDVLACEPESKLCLPAAVCVSNLNCCGFVDFVCDPASRLCRPRSQDCPPPQEVESECPFLPKDASECGSGFFCTSLGECVQCACDEDCNLASGANTGLKCYLPTRECKPKTFCTHANECDYPTESCDRKRQECAPRCANHDECSDLQFCDGADEVCRSKADLPCTADVYDTMGNDTADAALGNGVTLDRPDLGGAPTVMDNLSLCEGDEDWYTVQLDRGDHLTIAGSSVTALMADMVAYGPDGVTLFNTGFIGGSQNLAFTANRDTQLYYVQVVTYSDSAGTYRLRIDRSAGTPCADPFEANHHIDDSPKEATFLNDTDIDADIRSSGDCTLTGLLNDDHTVTCETPRMCLGDVDFYLARVPAGADLDVTIRNFSNNLDLFLFGPFAAPADATGDPAYLLASSEHDDGGTEQVQSTARQEAVYLVSVKRVLGLETDYIIDATVTVSQTSCTEDTYDAASLNDTSATATQVPLVAATPLQENLRLCRADIDWLQLGKSDGGFQNIPPNLRVQIDLTAGNEVISLAAGYDPGNLIFGSTDLEDPSRSIFITRTSGDPIYLKVFGPMPGEDMVGYSLTLTLLEPDTCDYDNLGDEDAVSNNNAPKFAQLLNPPDWPDLADEIHRFPGPPPSSDKITSCKDDDDWHSFTVPSGTLALARVFYDPHEAELGLAAYDDSVQAIETTTPGEPLATGLLDNSTVDGRGFQRVLAPMAGSTVFFQVYNRSGWPSQSYALEVELISETCDVGSLGDNDEWQEAADVPFFSGRFDPQLQIALIDPLTMCTADEDWRRVDMGRGDRLTARLYFDSVDVSLDLKLYGPVLGTEPGTPLDLDLDPSNTGVAEVTYGVGDPDPEGDYLLQVVAENGTLVEDVIYHLEVQAWRNCIDDDWEPSNKDLPYTGAVFDADNDIVASLKLCRDEDWIQIVVPAGPPDIAIRVDGFQHGDGDIDLEVYQQDKTALAVGGTSHSKNDCEVVTLTGLGAGDVDDVYYIRVFLDPLRGPVRIGYTLNVSKSALTCPN